MTDPIKHTKVPLVEDREYYTTMSHFYRGEVGRTMIWRQRLDMTTNWAVITATGVITFALSHVEISHIVFMIANIIIFLLLTIEGRRYRYYDAFRARVRMLEAHLLAPVVMRQMERLEGDWRLLLAEDLLLPSFKIGVFESISRRLKRNYIWIFLILFVAWCLKIYLHPPHSEPVFSTLDFLNAAQKGQPLPSFIFWGVVIVFYSTIILLRLYAQKKRYASGEMERQAPSRSQWRI